jgi:hypothetical protein
MERRFAVYKMNLMLADSAQVVGGKLFVLGGGWSMIVSGSPFAVCGIIDIPWHQGTDWHTLRLELIDGDGEPVCLPSDGESEPKPLVIDLPPYRPTIGPHVKPGTALTWPFAVNVSPGMPLQPQSIYEWRLSIDGKNEEGWTLPFSTLPSQPLPQAA